MKHSILRNTIVTFASFIFVITIVSAWAPPGQPAPSGNVSAPVNVGAVAQLKAGSLQVASLVSEGSIKVGNTATECTADISGAIRWTGTEMQYCNESNQWLPFGGGGINMTFYDKSQTFPRGTKNNTTLTCNAGDVLVSGSCSAMHDPSYSFQALIQEPRGTDGWYCAAGDGNSLTGITLKCGKPGTSNASVPANCAQLASDADGNIICGTAVQQPPADKTLTCINLGYDTYNATTDRCEYTFIKKHIGMDATSLIIPGYFFNTLPDAIVTNEGCGLYCGYSPAEGGYAVEGFVNEAGEVTVKVSHVCRYPSLCGSGAPVAYTQTVTIADFRNSHSGNFSAVYGGGSHTWSYNNKCLYVNRAGTPVDSACFTK